MENKDIAANLCYYDLRNPEGIVSCSSMEEAKSEGCINSHRFQCHCDNCFYGRTQLAEYILKLKSDFNPHIPLTLSDK